MARTLRTLQQGEIKRFFPSQSTGVSVVNLPAAGTSVLTRGGNYVLGRPEEGTQKRLICVSSASAAVTVFGSTDGAAAVKFDNNALTVITFPVSTVDQCVDLVGINSTRWSVVNVHPYTTTALSPSLGTS